MVPGRCPPPGLQHLHRAVLCSSVWLQQPQTRGAPCTVAAEAFRKGRGGERLFPLAKRSLRQWGVSRRASTGCIATKSHQAADDLLHLTVDCKSCRIVKVLLHRFLPSSSPSNAPALPVTKGPKATGTELGLLQKSESGSQQKGGDVPAYNPSCPCDPLGTETSHGVCEVEESHFSEFGICRWFWTQLSSPCLLCKLLPFLRYLLTSLSPERTDIIWQLFSKGEKALSTLSVLFLVSCVSSPGQGRS